MKASIQFYKTLIKNLGLGKIFTTGMDVRNRNIKRQFAEPKSL